MVYCTKCGAKNEDNSVDCINCKASLQPTLPERSRRSGERRRKDECFGLPYGGAIIGLVIGALIIFSGLIALFVGNIGHMMGRFGDWMGKWGREFGEWMGNWGREFGEAVRSIISLQSIRMFGSLMMIIVGLVIIVAIIYSLNKTRP